MPKRCRLLLDDRSVLVMAHPDDEVLWASAALAGVGRVILAYEALPGRPDITAGRQAALARYPRPVESLRLAESASYGAAAWPEPVETPEGLAVAAGPGTMPGFDPAAYRAGFATLVDRLGPALAGARTVITHAPWGEYGHEDHVQLFRAVEALRPALGFALWVPAHASARSLPLMQRHLGRLGDPTPPMPTDRDLGSHLVRALPRDRLLDLGRRPCLATDRDLLSNPARAGGGGAGPQLPGDPRHPARRPGAAAAKPRRPGARPAPPPRRPSLSSGH